MKKRGILVGVHLNNSSDFEESMSELKNLCHACDIEAVQQVMQKAKTIHPKYYIGSGKIEELSSLVVQHEVDIIIFNNELSLSQIKNIENQLNCPIIDRTALILDIFAKRAQTREAKLQVEVAWLQYELPRLIGSRQNLGRQSGGVGTKNKGVGEKRLELDRRRVEDRIVDLNSQLEALKNQRLTQRGRRKKSNIPTVALVGYTNAGKSTVMNQMVDQFIEDDTKKVFEKDMLFATLETTVRSIKLPGNRTFLLSDTVGFVSDLPHDLVKAFRSTLEEVCEADLLIHVIDVSNPHHKAHIQVTNETLAQIGAESIPVIYAYNKVDLAKEMDMVDEGIYISAKKNIGIDRLLEQVCSNIFSDYTSARLLIPYEKGSLIAYINEYCVVVSSEYTADGIIFNIECSMDEYSKLKNYCL